MKKLVDILAPYKDRDDFYIHFSILPKLGIFAEKRKRSTDTPIGVYGYPIKIMWDQIVEDKIPYADYRKYVIVFQGQAMDLSDYSLNDYKRDIVKLRKLYKFHKLDLLQKPNALPFKRLLHITKVVANHLKIGDIEDSKWNAVFRYLSYNGFVDNGTATIYKSEPYQGMFFSTKNLKVIKIFENPKSLNISSEKIRKKSDGSFITYEYKNHKLNGFRYYNSNKKLDRKDGPAVMYGKESGKLHYIWYVNGEKHRIDGPAMIEPGIEAWYQNGEQHRDDGPAVIQQIGSKTIYFWYNQGKNITKLAKLFGDKIGKSADDYETWSNVDKIKYKEFITKYMS